MFEKDELSLSLKSLQEEHNKIFQENQVNQDIPSTEKNLLNC